MALVPAPSAVRTMIRARQTCFCGLLRLPMIVSSRTRSSAVTVMEIPLRITDTRTKPNLQKPIFGLFCQMLSTSACGDPPVALTLPDKPLVAVLPFTNMSGDPEQEFFADGIAEDIITALSRCPSLFVI